MGTLIERIKGKMVKEKEQNSSIKTSSKTNSLDSAEGLLLDARIDLTGKETFKIPIAELATLGTGVASLVPALRTVTQTTTISMAGYYQVTNASPGDTLKMAKNGNSLGILKTAKGPSKFAQFKEAGPISATSKTAMPINPATIMMAAALFSIELRLNDIAEMEQQIMSFLQEEKQSEIEADVETLVSMIKKYKFNWDNEHFVSSNHKLTLDIQRKARENINLYQKSVNDVLNAKKPIISNTQVNLVLNDLLKKIKYYRLSLYNFSLASLMEIMLSGNFEEENILCAKESVDSLSMTYRDIYKKCSLYLEKLSNTSIENNILVGIGTASDKFGKLIGNISVLNKGPVDEFLQEGGARLKQNAAGIERKILASFASISNPETGVLTDKMNDLIQIYNRTTDICFDNKGVYLISG